jgi:hypothetical protein
LAKAAVKSGIIDQYMIGLVRLQHVALCGSFELVGVSEICHEVVMPLLGAGTEAQVYEALHQGGLGSGHEGHIGTEACQLCGYGLANAFAAARYECIASAEV